MKFSHVGIMVYDLELILSFYQNFFDSKIVKRNINKKTKLEICFILVEGITIELLQDSTQGRVKNPGHIAFEVNSEDIVNKSYKKALSFNLNIVSNPRITSLNDYYCSFEDVEGNLIEILYQIRGRKTE